MSKFVSIAIDGPAGAGKSTMARACAQALGYLYVDTGAIYRTVGYYMRLMGVGPKDKDGIARLIDEVNIDIRYEDGVQHMILNGADVTGEIRTPEMSMYASGVSAQPCVRAFLLDMQRQLARTHNVVMDGRDIGTVVLPKADVKIFLTASAEVRAKRRFDELQQKGDKTPYAQILAETKQSGMFTANSMNCLNEAIGLALPGNGTVVATHRNRERLFIQAARQIVENCRAYYQDGDESVLPRNIATRAAFLNAMTLDIAMGGSTNTVLHLLAIAQEAGVDFPSSFTCGRSPFTVISAN